MLSYPAQELRVRRIFLKLEQPTRDGDPKSPCSQSHRLTNASSVLIYTKRLESRNSFSVVPKL